MTEAAKNGHVRVEDPKLSNLTREEAEVFLTSWYRVVDSDGATIAYVPDKETAQRIAGLLD